MLLNLIPPLFTLFFIENFLFLTQILQPLRLLLQIWDFIMHSLHEFLMFSNLLLNPTSSKEILLIRCWLQLLLQTLVLDDEGLDSVFLLLDFFSVFYEFFHVIYNRFQMTNFWLIKHRPHHPWFLQKHLSHILNILLIWGIIFHYWCILNTWTTNLQLFLLLITSIPLHIPTHRLEERAKSTLLLLPIILRYWLNGRCILLNFNWPLHLWSRCCSHWLLYLGSFLRYKWLECWGWGHFWICHLHGCK